VAQRLLAVRPLFIPNLPNQKYNRYQHPSVLYQSRKHEKLPPRALLRYSDLAEMNFAIPPTQKIQPTSGNSNSKPSSPASATLCRSARWPRMAGQSRETVMFSSFLLLAGLFVVTGFLSKIFHTQQASLARYWAAQGEALLRNGNAPGAIEDYRSALVYEPDDRQNEFRLAQALAAAGRTQEAQAYLVRLLELSPGNGEINRELGRLAIRAGSEQEAIDYYHGAINGAWADRPRQQRIASREELSSFLLDAGDTTHAEDELLALAATVPDDDTTDVLQAAGLFLRARNLDRALREYQIVLKSDPRNPAALAAAGTCAYQLGDYRAAEDYLSRAQREGNRNATLSDMLEKMRAPVAPPDPGAKK
jgi:tetratricopeptide (TPR) repeat protein